jgi:hypothetical protein
MVNADDYDLFCVAICAPAAVAPKSRPSAWAPPVARPLLEAHVTVKGAFARPADLPAIGDRIRRCCAAVPPLTIVTKRFWLEGDERLVTIALHVEPSAPLDALHRCLVERLRGLCTTHYPGEDTGYFVPHMNIALDIPLPQLANFIGRARRDHTLDYAFEATEATLVGRRAGGGWEPLAVYPHARGRLAR